MRRILRCLSLGIVSTILSAIPALGAERIAFVYPPFGEFSLSTDALEVFAKQGKINYEFHYYAKRISPQQLAQIRSFLNTRLAVSPTLVSQFTYSPLGETVMQRLGEIFQTETRQNGFYALRSSFILSAADSEGLTIVNILRKFPSRSVRLNLSRSLKITRELAEQTKKRDAIVAAVKQEAAAEASIVDFSQQPDLRFPGSFSWQQKTLSLKDIARDRTLNVALYLPQSRTGASQQLAPVIVISHGAGENRNSFAYLAQHLASYGFAVAALEHPGINSQRFQQYFAGLADPPEPAESINQPIDVKYLLDELQRLDKSDPAFRGRLNLQQVGVLGHSLGGYAALTLAGAKINFEQLGRDCRRNNFLNISLLVQCKSADLPPAIYPLQDKRVKAVIAVNPLTSSIFGQSQLSQIQVPLMLVGGSQDIVTPAVPEQILPFTWLKTPEKYLVVIENATHFSTVGEAGSARDVLPVPPELIGPNPAIARLYLKALSVAFFQTHIANRSEYRSYLVAPYAKFISQAPLNLSLVQHFNLTNLKLTFGITLNSKTKRNDL